MLIRIVLTILPFFLVNCLEAEAFLPLFSLENQGIEQGSQTISINVQLMIILSLLTLLPALLLVMTSFTRVIIVLSILRQAIGFNQTPSNQILVGLSFFLTLYIMSPVFSEINALALQPYLSKALSPEMAAKKAILPLKKFMLTHTQESELIFFNHFLEKKNSKKTNSVAVIKNDSVSLFVLLPAFVVSELKIAFQMGFLLFVPFLIIDLLVSSVLMSMGMLMLSPMMISLPLKLMLFVVIDGWSLIIDTLASSYQ